MPKAVAYIVFSCDGEKTLRKHQRALTELLETLMAMDVKAGERAGCES